MSSLQPEDAFNPYAAPKTEISAEVIPEMGDLAQDEAIRKRYLPHEASIKAIGFLNYLGGTVEVIAGIVLLGFGIYRISRPEIAAPANNPELGTAFFLGVGSIALVLGVLIFLIGSGLRRLQPWARWSEVAVSALGVTVNLINLNPIAIAFPCYFLYLMLSKKGAMVFSPEYRDVIARTPHMRYRTSWIVKGFAIFLLGIILLAIVGGIAAVLFKK